MAVREKWYDVYAGSGYSPTTVVMRGWNETMSSWEVIDGCFLQEEYRGQQFAKAISLAGDVNRLVLGNTQETTSKEYSGQVEVFECAA